jgi:hypothetical protein
MTLSEKMSCESRICFFKYDAVLVCGNEMPILTGKHRAILRLLHFMRFMVLRRKFKRARMPYELDDAEDELCELEHRRLIAFRQVNL